MEKRCSKCNELLPVSGGPLHESICIYCGEITQQKEDLMTCPRCLGKGYVDKIDIARLDMKSHWKPGPCGYCHGKGQVRRGSPAVRSVRATADGTDMETDKIVTRGVLLSLICAMGWLIFASSQGWGAFPAVVVGMVIFFTIQAVVSLIALLSGERIT